MTALGSRGQLASGRIHLLRVQSAQYFAGCIRNDECDESIEIRAISEVLDDAIATGLNMIRVIDEEREDDLYPRDWFLPVEVARSVGGAIVELAHS